MTMPRRPELNHRSGHTRRRVQRQRQTILHGSEAGGEAMETHSCPQCGRRVLLSAEGAGTCPSCGWVAPVRPRNSTSYATADATTRPIAADALSADDRPLTEPAMLPVAPIAPVAPVAAPAHDDSATQ